MNHVTLLGNLATEPRTDTYTKRDGEPITKVSFLLAVDRGGRTQGVDWIRVIAWNRLGATLTAHNHKGSRVAVEGRLSSEFFNRDGGARGGELRVAVVATSIKFLSPSRRSEGEPPVLKVTRK